ncbi:Uncharacterised protein [Vibrio cholerae]|nr:Uncharacterised protein [Vibrio cholerae]
MARVEYAATSHIERLMAESCAVKDRQISKED